MKVRNFFLQMKQWRLKAVDSIAKFSNSIDAATRRPDHGR